MKEYSQQYYGLTISLVNSSERIAYLPANCFLTKATGGAEETILESAELSRSSSCISLQLMHKETDFHLHVNGKV